MSWLQSFSVYMRRDVFIVMLLGFSSGLPLALTGSTLSYWLVESKVSFTIIGLFAAAGTPYTLKFLWSPVVDAVKLPFFSKLGHRRGWLFLSQILLTLSIIALVFLDPKHDIAWIVVAAITIAFCSATQDIVVDSFRIESLSQDTQAAGAGAFIAAYRVAMLVSGAGLFLFVSYLEGQGFSQLAAWHYGFVLMAFAMVVGFIACFLAKEPEIIRADNSSVEGVFKTAKIAFADFLTMQNVAAVLAFVVFFKVCDAMAGVMIIPFINKLGFSRDEYAVIVKGVGFFASIAGGFAGGAIAKKLSLYQTLWLAGILQMVSNLAFIGLGLWGKDNFALSLVIMVENFTGAIGAVIFVAYLSSICKNPLHTATQFALLTALSAVGRTYLSTPSGWLVQQMGFMAFFGFTVVTAIPALFILLYLKKRNSF